MSQKLSTQLISDIKMLLHQARKTVVQSVNTTMVHTYFEIGRVIVEHEQAGAKRAEYGAETLKHLSNELIQEFGKGFSIRNLRNMRMFFQIYAKRQTVSAESASFKLSWSHYVFLISLLEDQRKFYEKESIENSWSLRELKRQFDSALYERIALNKDKTAVLQENLEKYHDPQKPKDVIKDPYILEFLGLEEDNKYSESELEQAIIDKLESFLLELGKGFAFVGRQKRFTFDEEHFFVDLVFYNRLLKCFVIIDLKVGKLKHQDLGQIQMYVNYFDRYVKTKEENLTIGIVLCTNKSDTLVKITLPEDNKQIFASNYQLYLPSKEELIAQIQETKTQVEEDLCTQKILEKQ